MCVFYDGTTLEVLEVEAVGTERVHGAGCTLAAAVTAELAKGASPLEAAVTAKEVSEALSEQYGVNIAKTKLVLDEPIKACGGYQIKAKLGYEVVGTVSVMVTEA